MSILLDALAGLGGAVVRLVTGRVKRKVVTEAEQDERRRDAVADDAKFEDECVESKDCTNIRLNGLGERIGPKP